MKLMKVFDCQDMPDNVRQIFFWLYDGKCNDSCVEWDVEPNEKYDDDDDVYREERTQVTAWLKDNGALLGECVIIKYWW